MPQGGLCSQYHLSPPNLSVSSMRGDLSPQNGPQSTRIPPTDSSLLSCPSRMWERITLKKALVHLPRTWSWPTARTGPLLASRSVLFTSRCGRVRPGEAAHLPNPIPPLRPRHRARPGREANTGRPGPHPSHCECGQCVTTTRGINQWEPGKARSGRPQGQMPLSRGATRLAHTAEGCHPASDGPAASHHPSRGTHARSQGLVTGRPPGFLTAQIHLLPGSEAPAPYEGPSGDTKP